MFLGLSLLLSLAMLLVPPASSTDDGDAFECYFGMVLIAIMMDDEMIVAHMRVVAPFPC